MTPDFSNVIAHLDLGARLHDSNALCAANADEVQKAEALAAEYRAAITALGGDPTPAKKPVSGSEESHAL